MMAGIRDSFDKLLASIKSDVMKSLNVSMMCRVISLDADKKHGNFQPMALTISGNARAMLINVPVTRNVAKDVEVGDVVIVLFQDRNIQSFDGTSKNFIINNERAHSVNDAVVVGLL